MKSKLKDFPNNCNCFCSKCDMMQTWRRDFEESLRSRLTTLEADAIKYVDCEFNAPKFRAGMIQQLRDILGEEE